MTDYRPPIRDLRFVLTNLVDMDGLRATGAFPNAEPDIIDGALEEAGRFIAEVVAPLARTADKTGSVRNPDGSVTTPPGYRQAYQRFVETGWPAISFPEEWGGGGMPFVIGLAVAEMLTSADMAFSLGPMLTYAANELLLLHGTEEQQATFLPRLVSGEWSGTMLLTEAQAGSDVGALTAKAVPAGDGTYRITGSKIFVTWGEHDLTDNIIHVTLARVPGAPPGTKGISLFLIPKVLVNDDGTLGPRNDLECVSIEEKVGIHASPTCVLSFGDHDGAVGYLVGEEQQGMRLMFIMMNTARLHVGTQGVAVAERAYQQALAYALERRQGQAVGTAKGTSSLIIEHADVRRMLMLMRSQIEAMRGVMYKTAAAIDVAHSHPDEAVRQRAADFVAIMTPVCKLWGTETGVELTSLGIQVHGGMGYIEETGAPQCWRDARITPIYEGSNGIQAADLVARKLTIGNGAAALALLAEIDGVAEQLNADESLARIGFLLHESVGTLRNTGVHLLTHLMQNPNDALAGATPFAEMFGIVAGGWVHGLSALAVRRLDPEGKDAFLQAKLATARFYAEHVLPKVAGLVGTATAGAASVFGVPVEAMRG
ncbi:MAG TPA: acyl-CoA dehydrogenase C-terminal domain-containing protein [Acidimicrobiia bacterium]|nr:acyl-CoA dehydrogenase C-terminal domain-containing protein [Acidimicrobiia bacterium]